MAKSRKKWVIIAVIALIILIPYSYLKGTYNGLVTMDESVKAAWAQVENQLQRRFDLIPNLVETVKGYAAQEKAPVYRPYISGPQYLPCCRWYRFQN